MYTIEELNTLTGKRSHRKASPYITKELAVERARELSGRYRKFVTINVLDARGHVVHSVEGKA